MSEFSLPKGWWREERAKKIGLSTGKVDVVYYGPDGRMYRSKQQLSRALGSTVDLSALDFRTGRVNPAVARKNKLHHQKGYPIQEYLRGLKVEACLVPPIRQTASIFKQPVTLVHQMKDSSSTKHEVKNGNQEKTKQPPHQLFWERRLQGLSTCDASGEPIRNIDLPRNIRGISSDLSQDTLLRSISTSLHLSAGPIVGQVNAKGQQDRHPAVYLNPEQPLVQALIVTEEEIRKQEEQVVLARKQLQNAYKDLEHVVEQ